MSTDLWRPHVGMALADILSVFLDLSAGCMFLTVTAGVVLLLWVLFHSYRLPNALEYMQQNHGKLRARHFESLLLGHRGCRGRNMPVENSLAAFKYAADHGAQGVELDTRLSQDGVPVVMHDDTVDRTLEGTGAVDSMSAHAFKQLRFKRLSGQTSPETIQWLRDGPPTLEDVIILCKERNLKLMIEVKERKRHREMAMAVASLYKKHNCYDWAFVASFSPTFLYRQRLADLRIETCMLYRKNLYAGWAAANLEGLPWWMVLAAPIIDPVNTLICEHLAPRFIGVGIMGPMACLVSEEVVSANRRAGLVTDTWVANVPVAKDWLASMKVIVTTDILFPQLVDPKLI